MKRSKPGRNTLDENGVFRRDLSKNKEIRYGVRGKSKRIVSQNSIEEMEDVQRRVEELQVQQGIKPVVFHRNRMAKIDLVKEEKTERVHIALAADELNAIDDFRFSKRIGTRSAAIRLLIQRGLESENPTSDNVVILSRHVAAPSAQAREILRGGGIIIPDTAKEKIVEGEIIAVGTGTRDDKGAVVALDVKAGDRVLFGKWSGMEVKINGEDVLIMKQSDIVGVIE